MIRRVVKMKFQEMHLETFFSLFYEVKDDIENMEGCYSVELMKDIKDPTLMFTYSIWEDEEKLNAYRKSDLFAKTWPRTKALFSAPAEAWSLDFV
ncbi:MAG: antibiotic biosynthesis monooxygenase [Saprospiraceae bacterium]|nr:antibiotic biosynthesis monooxygenase [Saprospiraceae bacterium]